MSDQQTTVREVIGEWLFKRWRDHPENIGPLEFSKRKEFQRDQFLRKADAILAALDEAGVVVLERRRAEKWQQCAVALDKWINEAKELDAGWTATAAVVAPQSLKAWIEAVQDVDLGLEPGDLDPLPPRATIEAAEKEGEG